MTKVAVAGFLHETNSFAPGLTGLSAFEAADAWPGMVVGEAMLAAFGQSNIAMAGFLKAAQEKAWEITPLLWCSAGPSGVVEGGAYDSISTDLLARLELAMPVDAVFLDLHGAMVSETETDADGVLLGRVRALVGPDVPIVAVLDFHANISEHMVAAADMLALYRTYPHVDIADTGRRAAGYLAGLLEGSRPEKILQPIPFLLPLGTQATLDGPVAALMAGLRKLERDTGARIEFAAGFPLADAFETGPAIVTYAPDRKLAEAVAHQSAGLLAAREKEFTLQTMSPREAVAAAQEGRHGHGPLLLIDTQDNPGGGAAGDTVGLLRAMIEGGCRRAVMGVLYDPETALQAHKVGVGGAFVASIGAKSCPGQELPLRGRARVMALGSGNFAGTGPFYKGCSFALGPMACLEVGGVRVVLSSVRQQAADQAMFRHVGVEPAEAGILALKSSVHYRADFDGIARGTIIVKSPGLNTASPADLTYRNVRPNVRVAGGEQLKRGTV
ncbi:M81 family metallopeptidase [Kordiimonas lipolytica]|uniref:Microcystinase C n=1 Tax=Kordiimonas lipolytica TaxID=1662421 RepID=A0ABV8UFL8_9PROT|nr:M81 family metallopeptidase [Kordiimonas lipolytica]